MRKNRTEIYLVIFIIAVIAAVTASAYLLTREKSSTSMFPDKLGDMRLALYRDGDVAMTEVKGLHGNNPSVKIENAYIENYRAALTAKPNSGYQSRNKRGSSIPS